MVKSGDKEKALNQGEDIWGAMSEANTKMDIGEFILLNSNMFQLLS